jgi:hypothetical protein
MPPKLSNRPKSPLSPRLVRRRALDLVARQAADYANKELRKLQDSQPKYKGSSVKVPVKDLSMKCLNMKAIAECFQEKLFAVGSTVHALTIRLCKWRTSGDRDIVKERGRPSTSKLSPVKMLGIESVVKTSQAHLSSAQVNAVAASLLGDSHSNKRQQRQQLRDLKKSNGFIRAVSKATGPALLHAATSKSLQFKLHDDLESAYRAEPSFEENPDAIVNFDENNDPDRAGKQGHKTYGFTTIARLKKEGRQQLRTIAIPDGAGVRLPAVPGLLHLVGWLQRLQLSRRPKVGILVLIFERLLPLLNRRGMAAFLSYREWVKITSLKETPGYFAQKVA